MLIPNKFLFGLLLIVFFSLHGNGHAEAPAKQAVVKVSLELIQTDNPITKDSNGIFKIIITNTADFTLYIYKDLEFGTTIFLKNDKHKDVYPKVIGDLCPPPPPRPGENIFMPIEPHKAVSVIYNRSLDDLGVAGPGQYFVTAYYFRYLTRDPEHAYPSLRDKPLNSNVIEITVR